MVINKIETNKPYEIHAIAEVAFFGITIFALNIISITFLVQALYSLPSFLVPF